MKKTLDPKEGWKNRHVDGIPSEGCYMEIIVEDVLEHVWWHPFHPADYEDGQLPSKGFLGCARRQSGFRIGWNLWEQNDYEFVYWRPKP